MTGTTEFSTADRLSDVILVEGDGPPPSAAVEQDRRVAAYELTEESAFRVDGAEGPFRLTIGVVGAELRFDVADAAGRAAAGCGVPTEAISGLVGEYVALCDAYRDAVAHLPPAQIEALDQERKRAHDEASALVAERLAPAIAMDAATARRLFTLVSALGSDLGGR